MKINNKNINSNIKICVLTKIFRAALFIVVIAAMKLKDAYSLEEKL